MSSNRRDRRASGNGPDRSTQRLEIGGNDRRRLHADQEQQGGLNLSPMQRKGLETALSALPETALCYFILSFIAGLAQASAMQFVDLVAHLISEAFSGSEPPTQRDVEEQERQLSGWKADLYQQLRTQMLELQVELTVGPTEERVANGFADLRSELLGNNRPQRASQRVEGRASRDYDHEGADGFEDESPRGDHRQRRQSQRMDRRPVEREASSGSRRSFRDNSSRRFGQRYVEPEEMSVDDMGIEELRDYLVVATRSNKQLSAKVRVMSVLFFIGWTCSMFFQTQIYAIGNWCVSESIAFVYSFGHKDLITREHEVARLKGEVQAHSKTMRGTIEQLRNANGEAEILAAQAEFETQMWSSRLTRERAVLQSEELDGIRKAYAPAASQAPATTAPQPVVHQSPAPVAAPVVTEPVATLPASAPAKAAPAAAETTTVPAVPASAEKTEVKTEVPAETE